MAFDLRIEFSGLCIYVQHPDKKHVAVLMPDARAGAVNPRHEDNSIGKAHIGYARFDFASLSGGIPLGNDDSGPAYELVHRFAGEILDLGLPAADADVVGSPQMPEFGKFAPSLSVVDGALNGGAVPQMLMRTVLRSGTITAAGKQKSWRFDDVLQPAGAEEYSGQFASVVLWTRRIDADSLTVKIRKFEGGDPTTLRLTPVDDGTGNKAITIKVANLCNDNPLEWPELELHFVDGDDLDFKWLYRLYQSDAGKLSKLLKGEPLPVPIQESLQTFGTQGCMGGTSTIAFDPNA